MELDLHPTPLAICRLDPLRATPDWVTGSTGPLVSVTRTVTELSIVAPQDEVPPRVRAERDWRAFAIRGPLDLSLTGVLAGLATALADAAIPIFAVSTYDTDWLLVRAPDVDRAVGVLEEIGHQVRRARD